MSRESVLSRRERERFRRRRAMLRAARTVFAEKGYGEATLEEIAHRAEFGKGTLYNYFEGGKEELLFSVLDELYDSYCELTKEMLAEEKFKERTVKCVFHDYIEAVIVHFTEQKEFFMLLIKEVHRMALDDETKKSTYFCEQNERFKQYLIPPIERAIARGDLKPFPPRAIANTIVGNVHGYLMGACSETKGRAELVDPKQAAEFLTTVLFDGLTVSDE